MRKGSQKTGLRSDLNYKQRHHLVKMMSIITLLCLMVQTFLSPISQYVNAQGTVLGLSLSAASVNESEVFVATLTDTSDESSGPYSFTVPEGLTISGVVEGQGNIEEISHDNQTLQFNWAENGSKVVKVQVQAQKAGNYAPAFTSSNSAVTTTVSVLATATEEVAEGAESSQGETAATEEESSDDEEGDSAVSQEESAVEEAEGDAAAATEEETETQSDDNLSSYALGDGGTYGHIDIMSTGSFTYVVDGEEIQVDLEFTNANINDVNIYDKNGDRLNITPRLQQSTTAGYSTEWRFNGTFNKDDNYTVKYRFNININGTPTEFLFEKTYNFYSTDNICPGWGSTKGLDLAIKGSDLSDHFTSGIIIRKVVTSDDNSLNGTFNFNVLNSDGNPVKTVSVTTTNGSGSTVISGLQPGEYTVVESSPPTSIGSSNLVSIKAGDNTYSASDSGPYQTAVTVEKGNNKSVTFENTYTQEKPSITIEKSIVNKEPVDGAYIFAPGDEVEYEIKVTNNGNVNLSGLSLTDVLSRDTALASEQLKITGDVNKDNFSLNVNASEIFTATFTVPENEAGGTVYTNTATVKNDKVEQSDDAAFTVESQPELGVTKTVSQDTANPGDVVTYTITVKNEGNTPLSNVTLTDLIKENNVDMSQQLTLMDGKTEYTGGAFALAIGESKTFTADFTIPASAKANTTYDNTATAVSGNLSDSDTAKVTVSEVPGLTVDKKVDKNVAKPGETVTYTYTVTNTGNSDLKVTLEDVISKGTDKLDKQLDLKYPNGNSYEGEKFELASGESIDFTATFTIPAKTKSGTEFNNVVTAKSGELTATDNETVTVDKDPALSVDKSVDKNVAKPGEKVTYTYTVTNLGNSDLDVTLADVISENDKVMDKQLVLKKVDGSVYDGGTFKLAYEETVVFTAEFTIPADTKVDTVFHNVVTATSGDIVKKDEEEVTVANNPGLEVEKSVSKNEALPGETVTYKYKVTNTGNSDLEVTLADVFSKNGKELDDQLILKDVDGKTYDGKAFKLAYKGTATFTAEYKIPANTKVDTVFHNVVTATSGDLTDTDAEDVTVLNNPGLEVEKSVNKNEAKPGETVTYTYTVTNTGNSDLEVTLADVFSENGKELDDQLVLKDKDGNIYDGKAFTLAYKGVVTFTAEYTIPANTKVDTVFHNEVTVKSGDLTDTDKEDVTVLNDPGLKVEKSVNKNEAKPGETVTYTYKVTNTGNSDLEVTLADVFSKDGKKLDDQLVLKDVEGKTYDGKAFKLAYKGTATFTAEYKIPENTKVDTVFNNVVTVKSGDLTDKDEENVTVSSVPGLKVDKSVDKNEAKPGDTVTYTYKVTNTGNSDLKVTLADMFSKDGNVMPADEQLVLKDEKGNKYDGKAFTLAYEDTVTFTAEYKIPANTKVDTVFHNVVTATSGDLTDTDAEDVTVLNDPGLSVDKSVDKNEAKPGEKVTYTYTVMNTGNSDLEVTLADVFSENGKELDGQLVLKDKDGNIYDGKAFTLAYKGVVTFTAEYTIPANTKVDTQFKNVVTVKADGVEDSDEETVTVTEDPGMTVDKSVDKNVAKPGETVTYTYTVTNTGNSDLKVTLADVFSKNGKELDDQLVLKDKDGNIYDGKAFALAYKGVVTFTAEYTIPANTKEGTKFDNVVTVKSGDLSATDNETVTVDKDPALSVDKSVDKNVAKPGEKVTYTYTVTNLGNSDLEVTLADVISENDQVMDNQLVLKKADGSVYDGGAFKLAYGETVVFTAEFTIPANTKVDTVFHNVVTATSGDIVKKDEEEVTVANDPGLDVEKSVSKNEALPGETVTYTYTVTNTGNSDLEVTLADVFSKNGKKLDDQLILKDADGKTYDGKAFTLAYEDTVTFTAEYKIPENTKVDTVFHNVVTATSGDLTDTDAEDVTVLNDPGLSVDKSVDKNEAKPGEKVTYTYTVTNTGNSDLEVTLADVFSENGKELDDQLVLKDKDGNIYDGKAFTLAYEGVVTFTAEYTIPANTKVDTQFKNVVTVKADDLEDTDEETVTVAEDPGMTVDKSVDKNVAKPGETVTYTYTVTNTGNSDLKVTLTDVFSRNGKELDDQLVLKDKDGNIYDGKAFTLAYKGVVTFTAEYTIPANTKADTQFHNVVTVISGDLEASDEETVTVDRDPSMTVEKTADKNIAKPGETVTYTITVANTGNTDLNVTLSDVFSENGEVLDEQLVLKDVEGNEYKGEAFTLAYEETATFTAEYTIPEDAKADTVYHNVVTAADGDVVNTDDEDVTVDQVPSLKVEKTADKTQYLPGETVTYTINVTNDGNVDFEGITLEDVFSKNDVAADQQLTIEGYDGAFDLAIGETASFTSKFVIPENDLADTTYKNVVKATTGDTAGEDEETIVVDPTYAFTIEKTADKTEATVGDTVTYTIVVTNTGNKALTNVNVKDEMIGLDTVINQLEVNGSKTFTGEHVVTADDIGELENIATASVEMDGKTIVHDASAIVKVSAKAAAVVDEEPPTTIDKVVTWIQNPKTGDATLNTLLILFVFVLAGSGLYVYRRKHRG